MITAKPDWLKVKLPTGDNYLTVRERVKGLNLHTVCQEALCPNLAECWGAKTATIMILGDVCTRGCRFCAVKTGNPRKVADWDEPRRVGEACQELGWQYVVLTAVDRDDLPDGGAGIFAETVRQIHQRLPETKVECLTGDFRGNTDQVQIVLESGMDVFAHNLETVRRLTPSVRDRRATFDQSLAVLTYAKASAKARFVKTSLMLGLGETEDEIEATMDEARAAGVDIFTLGQYLQPTKKHLPVVEFVPPEKFQRLKRLGLSKGFRQVVAGPLVRSSYHAEEAFQ
ncbi:MAG TPA: lipoyl synthase [Candidatus Dormibacteraeota bacterium]|nr:lipoyl synthase [Candidatus Dormibacteraeota bacterium]